MKTKPAFTLFFSLIISVLSAQKKDSISVKPKYTPNFMAGVDVLSLGTGFFSDRKLFQGFISSKIKKDIHAIAEAGFEKNTYKKNGYDATANGPFVKLGAFYMLAKDPENEFNGFYGGGKLAASFYHQEYRAVPIRGFEGNSYSVAFPSSSQSSYWLEATVGGRVQLFSSNFYIDVNVQPKYILYSAKQDDIKPMIVPGFGKSSSNFNLGFAWNVAYRF